MGYGLIALNKPQLSDCHNIPFAHICKLITYRLSMSLPCNTSTYLYICFQCQSELVTTLHLLTDLHHGEDVSEKVELWSGLVAAEVHHLQRYLLTRDNQPAPLPPQRSLYECMGTTEAVPATSPVHGNNSSCTSYIMS